MTNEPNTGEGSSGNDLEEPARDYEAEWKALWQQVVGLHHRWQTYTELYRQDAARVDLLNKSARSFFASLQRMLLSDVYLGIARLTDRLKVAGKDNLVLERLLEQPAVTGSEDLSKSMKAKLEAAADAAKPFRTHRNKIIAHLDLAHATDVEENPLPSITSEAVDKALAAFAELMNEFSLGVNDTHIFFDEIVDTGGADFLLDRLRDADEWRQEKRRRRLGES